VGLGGIQKSCAVVRLCETALVVVRAHRHGLPARVSQRGFSRPSREAQKNGALGQRLDPRRRKIPSTCSNAPVGMRETGNTSNRAKPCSASHLITSPISGAPLLYSSSDNSITMAT